MGESYRGLTIRIGADTSSLQKALRGVNGAISSTQSELRKVKQALNFDASGVKAAAEGMKLATNRAAQLEARLQTVRRYEAALGQSAGAKRLSNSLYDAQLAAQKANAEYNKVNKTLEQLKRNMSFKSGVNLMEMDDEGVRKTVEAFSRLKNELGDVARKYKEVRSTWQAASDELSTAKMAAQLQDARLEGARLEAQLSQVGDQMLSFSRTEFANRMKADFKELANGANIADSAIDSLKAEISTLDEALKLNPQSLETARAKMNALRQASETTATKIDTIQKSLEGLASKFGIDVLENSMQNVHVEVERTSAALKEANAQLATARGRMEALNIKAEELGNAINSTRGKTGMEVEYSQAVSDLREVQAQLHLTTQDVKQYEQAAREASRAFETSQAKAQVREFSTQLSAAKAELQGYANQMQEAGRKGGTSFSSMTTLGLSFYSTLTPAVQQFASYAISSAESVDAQYRNMRKTVQGSEQEFENLLDSALEFSQSNFTSADTLLSIEAMGGQLGIAVENLDEFAKTAAHLDIATDLSAEEISTAMGQLSGIMTDLTADKFPNFGDALVRLGNNAPAVESSIVEITKRIGSMGSIVGFSTPEILAWATAVASTGQNSEAAGTAISKTMSDIEQAVSEGGDKLQAWADVAQMSAEDFARSWQESPSDAMKAFVEGLKAVDEAGGSVDSTLSDLGINEVRQKQALQGLTQTIGDLGDYLTMSNDAWDGVTDKWGMAGDAAREAEKKSEGFSGQLQILRNNAQVLSSEVASAMLPVLEMAIELLQSLTDWFRSLSPEMQTAVVGAVALSGALGPLLTVMAAGGNVLTQFRDNMRNSSGAFEALAQHSRTFASAAELASANTSTLAGRQKALATAAKASRVAINLLGTALKTIGFGLALAAIGALIGYFADAKAKADEFKGATEGISEALSAMDSAIAGTSTNVEKVGKSFSDVIKSADEAIESQSNLATEMKDTWDEFGANSSLLSRYMSTIEELAGKSGLAADEQAELQAAVAGVNEITGSNYSVIDAQNGVLNASTDAIKANTEAWLANAKAQAAQEQMVELAKEEIELQNQRADINDEIFENQQKLNEARANGSTEDGKYLNRLEELRGKLTENYEALLSNADAQRRVTEVAAQAQTQLATTATAFQDLINGNNEWNTALGEAGVDIGAFSQRLSELGLSTADLSDASVEALTFLAQNSSMSAQEILNAFDQAGIQLPEKLRTALSNAALAAQDSIEQFRLAGNAEAQAWLQGLGEGGANAVFATSQLTGMSLDQLYAAQAQYQLAGDGAVQAWCSAIQMGAEPSAAAAAVVSGLTIEQLQSMSAQFGEQAGVAIAAYCTALQNGASQADAATAALEAATEAGYNPDGTQGAQEFTDSANSTIANGDTSGSEAYSQATEDAYQPDFTEGAQSAIDSANSTFASGDTSGAQSWAQSYVDAANSAMQQLSSLDFAGALSGPFTAAQEAASTAGTTTGQNFATGVSNTAGDTSSAAQSHADATSAMNSNSGSAFGWGSSLGSNFAAGILSQLGAVQAATAQLAAAAALPIEHSTPKYGPLRDDDEWGGHLADNFAEGITSGTPKVAKASLGIAQTVADYLEHSSPTKGPLRGGEWVFGYHTAINYADGLYSGSGAVGDAMGSIEDELTDGEKWLKDYLAKVDRLYSGFEAQIAEHAEDVKGLIWGVWQSMADDEWVRPFKGNVYESMKLIEEAGYDLEGWKERLAQAAEEQVEWQRKLEDLEWDTREQEKKKAEADEWDEFDQRSYDEWMRSRQDTLDEYAEWLAEYEQLKAVEASLTASVPELEEWQDLYKMKSDVTAMTDDAEALSDALWDAGQSGATFSQEFIDYIKDNGPEAVHALSQLTDLGKDQLQELSDSFRDAALAEREAELNARSLYVNSLQYTNFKTQKAQLLDFRETCLDVKEAVYSSDGLSWAFEQTGTYIEGFALDLESLNMTMKDFQSYYDGFVDSVSNGFALMANENMTSLDEWSDTLVSNGQIAKDWSEDLKKVFGTLGTGPEVDAFRQEVLEGGYEKWGRIIDELAEQDEASMKRYLDTFNTSLEEAQLYGIEAFKALAPGEEIVNSLIEGMQQKQEDMNAAMQGASDAANDVMQATKPEWFDTGAIVAGELEDGIRSQISSIAAAAAETVRRAIAAARAAAGSGTGAAISGATTAAGIIGSAVSRSGYAAVKAMPAMAPMAAKATQAVNNIANTSNVTMNFTVNTQPGQTVDVYSLAKHINTIQNREMKARGYR